MDAWSDWPSANCTKMKSDFSPEVRYVDISGVRLAYDVGGRGANLLFLHGGLLDRRMWDRQFAFFFTKYRTIRYDMRGAGQTETTPSAEPFTHHEDLHDFLGALKINRVSLVGLSNYAVALDFTIAHPQLIEKLVLVSPGLRGYEPRDPWLRTNFASMMQALGKQDLTGAVEVFISMWVDGPYRMPTDVDSAVREQVREMATRSLGLSRLAPNCTGLEPPAAGRLSEVHVPTLIILGDKDAPDIQAIGQLIRKGVTGSRLETIRDAGWPMI